MRSLHGAIGEAHLEVVALLLQLGLVRVRHLGCSLGDLVGGFHLRLEVTVVAAESKVVGALHLGVEHSRSLVDVALASQLGGERTHGDGLHVLLVGPVGPVRSSKFVLHFLVHFHRLERGGRALEVEGVRGGNQGSLAVTRVEVRGLHFHVRLSDVEVVVALGVGLVLAMRERVSSGFGYKKDRMVSSVVSKIEFC